MDKILLAIDCGTQSLRASLFDTGGMLLAMERVAYSYTSPQPGWAEQDPEIYWQGLCRACQALKEREPVLFGRIAGVAVTTMRNSIVNVDREGNPLRHAILWPDQRKAERLARLDPLTRLAHGIVGMSEAVAISQKDSKVNWVRQYEPDIWAATHKLLLVSGFLNHRLTARFTDSIASQIGYIPFDYKKRRWASPRDFKSTIFRIEREKLPELVEAGQILGTVSTAAAEATGLPPGLPVISAGSDKGCETMGLGCIDTGTASLSFGTAATVQTTSPRYREPIRFMPAYPAPLPRYYNLEVQVFRGFWMVEWFKKEFGMAEVQQSMADGTSPEQLLNRLLHDTPPGAMGLMLQPYWGPGLKTPEAKGAMIGFGDIHTRAHTYRAMVEGLGFSLKDGLGRIEKCSGSKVTRLFVAGGGSQSDEICQVTADIFGLPLYRGETPEAGGLGAAIVTAVGLGIYPGFREAVVAMVRHTSEFLPDPQRAKLYRDLYTRVYLRLYDTLKPLYREIREIINFPEKVK